MHSEDDSKSKKEEDSNQKEEHELGDDEENHRKNHMILAMEHGNGSNYDPLIDFNFRTYAVECETQTETHQPQTWDYSC